MATLTPVEVVATVRPPIVRPGFTTPTPRWRSYQQTPTPQSSPPELTPSTGVEDGEEYMPTTPADVQHTIPETPSKPNRRQTGKALTDIETAIQEFADTASIVTANKDITQPFDNTLDDGPRILIRPGITKRSPPFHPPHRPSSSSTQSGLGNSTDHSDTPRARQLLRQLRSSNGLSSSCEEPELADAIIKKEETFVFKSATPVTEPEIDVRLVADRKHLKSEFPPLSAKVDITLSPPSKVTKDTVDATESNTKQDDINRGFSAIFKDIPLLSETDHYVQESAQWERSPSAFNFTVASLKATLSMAKSEVAETANITVNQSAFCRTAAAAALSPRKTGETQSCSDRNTDRYSSQLCRILPTWAFSWYQQDCKRCCAGLGTSPTQRCKKTVKTELPYDNGLAIVRESLSMQTPLAALDLMREVISAIVCTGGHHRKRAHKELDLIAKDLRDSPATRSSWVSPLGQAIALWLNALHTAEPPAVREQAHVMVTRSMTRHKKFVNNFSTPNVYEPMPPSKAKASMNIPSLLKDVLKKPLGVSELDSGFIYIFWKRGDFGKVKIGYTTRTIEERQSEWRKSCGDDAVENFPLGKELSGGMIRLPFVKRIEALVHAEFTFKRLRQLNCRCKKRHKEWFDIDAAFTATVVEKYASWMVQEKPYRLDENSGRRVLVVTEERMAELCQPSPEPTSNSGQFLQTKSSSRNSKTPSPRRAQKQAASRSRSSPPKASTLQKSAQG